MTSATPTEAGFLTFVRSYMGVPVSALADDSPSLDYAFKAAMTWVPYSAGLALVPFWYLSAVYNLGGSFLIRFAQDISPSTYFSDLRKKFGMNAAVKAGVISSASDESTSSAMSVGDAMSNLSLADLHMMQDPYGRQALAVLMEMGPLWGYS